MRAAAVGLAETRCHRLEVSATRFLAHFLGITASICAIWVDDVTVLKDTLSVKGYEVIGQVPEDFADGYVASDGQMYRILFISGPGAVTFELFEIRK